MADKAQSETENHWCFIVNRKLWNDIQLTLGEYLANFKTDGAYLYTKGTKEGTGGYVKVGATYSAYEYAKLILFLA